MNEGKNTRHYLEVEGASTHIEVPVDNDRSRSEVGFATSDSAEGVVVRAGSEKTYKQMMELMWNEPDEQPEDEETQKLRVANDGKNPGISTSTF